MKEVRLLHCGCRNFSHFVYNRMVLTKLTSIDRNQATGYNPLQCLFISLIHACAANEILKWVHCVCRGGGGGQSSELSVGVRRSGFLNGEAIPDENMLFNVRLYALVVVLKLLLNFRL